MRSNLFKQRLHPEESRKLRATFPFRFGTIQHRPKKRLRTLLPRRNLPFQEVHHRHGSQLYRLCPGHLEVRLFPDICHDMPQEVIGIVPISHGSVDFNQFPGRRTVAGRSGILWQALQFRLQGMSLHEEIIIFSL